MALDFVALEVYEKLQVILRAVILDFLLNLDFCEFSDIEINVIWTSLTTTTSYTQKIKLIRFSRIKNESILLFAK